MSEGYKISFIFKSGKTIGGFQERRWGVFFKWRYRISIETFCRHQSTKLRLHTRKLNSSTATMIANEGLDIRGAERIAMTPSFSTRGKIRYKTAVGEK
mmetsp:Transcript_35515/g.111084  ORF Transcript_35515/g.111084 Transcript_35515/m.111084 type:complete len:98 (-) Transcript_35515:1138-1431(-)